MSPDLQEPQTRLHQNIENNIPTCDLELPSLLF